MPSGRIPVGKTFVYEFDWKGAFQKLTDACKACHQTFRTENAGQHH